VAAYSPPVFIWSIASCEPSTPVGNISSSRLTVPIACMTPCAMSSSRV
jgi:hypothetical protein